MSDTDLKRQLFDAAIENEVLRRLGRGLSKAQLEDIVERGWERLGSIADVGSPVFKYEVDLLFSHLSNEAPHLTTLAESPAPSPNSGRPITARQKLELANQQLAAERAAAKDAAA